MAQVLKYHKYHKVYSLLFSIDVTTIWDQKLCDEPESVTETLKGQLINWKH